MSLLVELATGIDTCAHGIAIEFKGKTIGVLGRWLLSYVSESNIPLARKMIEKSVAHFRISAI